ncbi:hypothetical protein [Bacillus sp. REN3]|uniref:hypothetical protein n=1 Tax=Bacillus sp. REN3 TaxID=2802440 RepID=UPI001AED2EFF|nr:hypothetical protein [Bacillus sp. REN3]
MMTKNIGLLICLSIVALSGCSSEETGQSAKQLEEKTKEAAEKVKKETPGLIENMKETYKESEKEVMDNTLQKGEIVIVEKNAYLALTTDAYEELYQLIEFNNLEGVDQIIKKDKVKEVEKGSKAEILERDIRRVKVKMNVSRQEGYLPVSLLQPKK